MFGHQDSNSNDAGMQTDTPAVNGILSHPIAPQTVAPTSAAPTAGGSADDDQFIMTDVATPPAAPAPTGVPAPPADLAPAPEVPELSVPAPSTPSTVPTVDGGLLELKQSALHELTPLLDHLEQSAEERFRTMMMMIQASDDQSLLAEAYQAAQRIEDKKARAQALLDVVNEINYFTQQPADGGSQQ